MNSHAIIREYFKKFHNIEVQGLPLEYLVRAHYELAQQKHDLADAPEGETGYRYCLDALLATLYDLESQLVNHYEDIGSYAFYDLKDQIEAGYGRAGELAGRLFDKYIGEWK